MRSRQLPILIATLCIGGGLLLAVQSPVHPVEAGSSAKARGAELFATRGCAHCHGDHGIGGGIGPDLQNVRKRMNSHAMQLQIHDGGKGMPDYGDELSSAQIDDLIAYLRSKRKPVPATPPASAAHPAQ
jgi:mono/diheme cytochrome c family protein